MSTGGLAKELIKANIKLSPASMSKYLECEDKFSDPFLSAVQENKSAKNYSQNKSTATINAEVVSWQHVV